jgi:hypothetical protein
MVRHTSLSPCVLRCTLGGASDRPSPAAAGRPRWRETGECPPGWRGSVPPVRAGSSDTRGARRCSAPPVASTIGEMSENQRLGDPSMIARFRRIANLKSCKKCAKSARIDLHHLRVHDPRENRDLLAKFRANRTNGFRDIAKTKICLIDCRQRVPFVLVKIPRDGILDMNLTRESSLLLPASHSPF